MHKGPTQAHIVAATLRAVIIPSVSLRAQSVAMNRCDTDAGPMFGTEKRLWRKCCSGNGCAHPCPLVAILENAKTAQPKGFPGSSPESRVAKVHPANYPRVKNASKVIRLCLL